jgi:hypothetical protein
MKNKKDIQLFTGTFITELKIKKTGKIKKKKGYFLVAAESYEKALEIVEAKFNKEQFFLTDKIEFKNGIKNNKFIHWSFPFIPKKNFSNDGPIISSYIS